MNKTTGIIIGIVIIAVTALGVYASMNRDTAMMDAKMGKSSGMEGKEVTMKENGADIMEKEKMEGDAMMGDDGAMMQKGSYEAYSADKLERAGTGDVILFFHASWCPSCRGLNADIEKNQSAIPSGVSLLKVDYDTESELKKKYGVTYQHTLVQVDANGTMIKKWSGSPTLTNLVAEIE